MIRWIKAWAAGLAASALLVACGGGGGNPGGCALGCGGGGGGSDVANLIISGVPSSLANGSPDPVSMTVTAINASNQVVADAPVSISADNGAVVIVDSATTGANGEVTATVGIGDDATPRTITITVISGGVTRTKSFAVVEGTGGGQPELVMTLSSQTVTATSPATVTVTVRDAAGVAVPSTVVSFATLGGLGTFSATTALTDAFGQASVALYASSTTSGADTVVASATVDGTVVAASSGFQITATAVTISSFTSDLGGARLSAYGQANLTVTLSGAAPGTPVALSIVSLCVNKGKATITPPTQTTTNGVASFTYKDAQCGATDTNDTVQVTITGTTTTASLNIPLTEPDVSSLGFVSASPETIYLKGSGFTETSTVTFVVKDAAGNPLPNQNVQLELTTLTGGLTLDGTNVAVNKVSDSNGQVTGRINSGTVPTPVRVKATLVDDNGISTVSSNLSVAVGLPSQLNFSLSQGTINIEGMNYDGTPNTYTIYASDRLGNPVPAGTSINFVTEGGQIESSKQISIVDGIGSATVNFRTSSPRPADGRVTVLAYALGEESFLDTNGDNVFTTGSETFQDLGDVFLSRSYSAVYDPVVDQFISLGISGTQACAAVDPLKDPNGLLAIDASIPSVGGTTCDGVWGRAYVRRAVETVFSTSASRLMWFRRSAGTLDRVTSGIKIDNGCSTFSIVGDSGAQATYFLMGDGALYNMPVQGSVNFVVSDQNANRLNPMPAGSTVTVSATTGITVSVGGGTPVPSTSSATAASVLYKFTDAASGSITVTTTSPKGVGTSFTVDVTTSSSPPSGAACTQ
jgi:hypothetical protein